MTWTGVIQEAGIVLSTYDLTVDLSMSFGDRLTLVNFEVYITDVHGCNTCMTFINHATFVEGIIRKRKKEKPISVQWCNLNMFYCCEILAVPFSYHPYSLSLCSVDVML